jgi:hypothetical protein
MTIATAHDIALTADASVPGSFRYFMLIPAGAAGDQLRVRLAGPDAGSVQVADVFIGHWGDVLDFTGPIRPLRVNGLNAVQLGAGQRVWSDPIALTVAAGDMLAITFDLIGVAGSKYRWRSGLGSPFKLSWKAGAGGPSNGLASRSGYADIAGAVAVVDMILAGAAEDFAADAGDDDPLLDPEAAAMAAIAADRLYAAGAHAAGIADKLTHFFLRNPAGSERTAYLRQVVMTPDVDCLVSVRYLPTLAEGAVLIPSQCNLRFVGSGAPFSIAKLHVGALDAVAGSQHALFRLRGGMPFALNRTREPMLSLAPEAIAAIALHAPGVGATLTAEWREEP